MCNKWPCTRSHFLCALSIILSDSIWNWWNCSGFHYIWLKQTYFRLYWLISLDVSVVTAWITVHFRWPWLFVTFRFILVSDQIATTQTHKHTHSHVVKVNIHMSKCKSIYFRNRASRLSICKLKPCKKKKIGYACVVAQCAIMP